MPESLPIALTALLLAGGQADAPASAPGPGIQVVQAEPDAPVTSRRLVNLTQEDRYIIREIILKDAKVVKAPDGISVSIGATVPQGVALQPVPNDVIRKVPQLKNNMFFVKGEEIVIVEPKDNTVADVVK